MAHERPTWEIYATDISEKVLHVARNNAQQLGLKNVSFYQGNWCTALPCVDFDVIVSNPPYIAESEWPTYAKGLAFEPRSALVSGCDGLDAIREVCASAKHYLRPSGCLVIEHGFAQGNMVRCLFAEAGYHDIQSFKILLNMKG